MKKFIGIFGILLLSVSYASALNCIDLQKNLTKGKENADVAILQNFLVEKGFLTVKPTGYFGNYTFLAVKKYQKSIRLTQSGGVLSLTRTALKNETCNQKIVAQPNDTKKEMSKVLIKSFFSVQGMANTVTIFNDKSFIEDKNPIDTGKSCNKGIISDVDYISFVSYLKSTDFMKKKLEQKNDSTMLCEGFSSLEVAIDGKINKISSICAREDSVQTKETFKLVQEIETKMKELIKKSPQTTCSTSTNIDK